MPPRMDGLVESLELEEEELHVLLLLAVVDCFP